MRNLVRTPSRTRPHGGTRRLSDEPRLMYFSARFPRSMTDRPHQKQGFRLDRRGAPTLATGQYINNDRFGDRSQTVTPGFADPVHQIENR